MLIDLLTRPPSHHPISSCSSDLLLQLPAAQVLLRRLQVSESKRATLSQRFLLPTPSSNVVCLGTCCLVLYGGISHLHSSLPPVCAAAAAGSAAVGLAAPGAGGAGLQAEGEQRLQLRVNTLSSFHTRQKLTRQPRHLVFFAGAALADMLLAKLEAVRLQGEATAAKVESTAAKVDVTINNTRQYQRKQY